MSDKPKPSCAPANIEIEGADPIADLITFEIRTLHGHVAQLQALQDFSDTAYFDTREHVLNLLENMNKGARDVLKIYQHAASISKPRHSELPS